VKPTESTRVPPKPILTFAFHAIVLTVLIGNWPTPRAVFPELFHAQTNAVLELLGSDVRLRAPDPGSQIETDTLMERIPGPGPEPLWTSWFDVARIGYWPLAGFLALLFATPLPAARRALSALIGVALLDALALGRIGVEIAYANYEVAHGPGGAAHGALHVLLRAGSESLTATIPGAAGVFAIWVAVGSPWRTLDLSAARALLGMSPLGARSSPGAGA
jgi:hypothetical protein